MRLVVAALLLAAPPIFALEKSATLGVMAEVLPACSAGSIDPVSAGQFGTLDFGTYVGLNAAVTAAMSGTGAGLRILCVADTPYRVLIGPGSSGDVQARTLLGPGGQALRYNLYSTSDFATVWDDSSGLSGLGSGSEQWLPVYGRIPAQAVPGPGTYSDAVTVTVSW